MPFQIMMIRPHLDELPVFKLPEPYKIRWHVEGDAGHWMSIKAASDLYHHAPPDYFQSVYGQHLDAVGQRQAFLCDESGEPVGTVTAWWFEELSDPSLGKVNWMLIAPRVQGRGLAKPLLATCCARLAALGHARAALYTLTSRIPAINLYRSFGFVPLIRHQADVEAWVATGPRMSNPYTATDYLSVAEAGINWAGSSGPGR